MIKLSLSSFKFLFIEFFGLVDGSTILLAHEPEGFHISLSPQYLDLMDR